MTAQQLLARPVLVLNKHQLAIDTTTVEVALCDIFRGHKKAIHLPTRLMCSWDQWAALTPEEGDLVIRGTRGPIVVPSVIVATWDGMPKKMPRKNRRGIGRRDKYICAYTNVYCPETGSLDHVIPLDQGGKSTWENLTWCDGPVNNKKANRTPEQAGLKLQRRPFKPVPLPAVVMIEAVLPEWEPFVVSRKA